MRSWNVTDGLKPLKKRLLAPYPPPLPWQLGQGRSGHSPRRWVRSLFLCTQLARCNDASQRAAPDCVQAHPGQKRKQVRAELVSVGGYTAPPSRHRTVLATSGEESDGQLIAHKTPRSNRDLPEGAIGVPARRFRSDHLPPLVLVGAASASYVSPPAEGVCSTLPCPALSGLPYA